MQYVAACCNVLQCDTVCCNMKDLTTERQVLLWVMSQVSVTSSTWHRSLSPQSSTEISRNYLAVCCCVLQCVAECCSVLQCEGSLDRGAGNVVTYVTRGVSLWRMSPVTLWSLLWRLFSRRRPERDLWHCDVCHVSQKRPVTFHQRALQKLGSFTIETWPCMEPTCSTAVCIRIYLSRYMHIYIYISNCTDIFILRERERERYTYVYTYASNCILCT